MQTSTSLLERLESSSGRPLLAGDFNFHVNDPSDNTATTFLDFLNCFNLEVCIVYTPTHKNNVLDLIITWPQLFERWITLSTG